MTSLHLFALLLVTFLRGSRNLQLIHSTRSLSKVGDWLNTVQAGWVADVHIESKFRVMSIVF